MMAWVVQTVLGEEEVTTALADPCYSQLALVLPSAVAVPVVPLWEDTGNGTLAVLVPAALAPWLEAELVVVASADDQANEAASGFCVAACAVVLSLVKSPPMLSKAPPGCSFTNNGSWPHYQQP